jgi:hypothetical protein
MGLDVFSPAESPKSMLTPVWAPITQHEPAVVLSAQGRTVRDQGPDGPRPGAGRSTAWREAKVSYLIAGRSVPWGWTVRACAGAAEDRRRRLDLAPGRDPVGKERSYVMSRLDRPT